MIFESLQAFGPNTCGSNLLINRFMKKEESLIFRIEQMLDQQLKRNLEESKLPQGALKLAPMASVDGESTAQSKINSKSKRDDEMRQRQDTLEEVCTKFNSMRAEIFNGFLIGFNQAT